MKNNIEQKFEQKRNWISLKDCKCPNCNNKLHFRLKGKTFKIKSFAGCAKNREDNIYFCSRCEYGFVITEKKYKYIRQKMEDKLRKDFEDNELFKTGLLSF